MRLQKHIKPIAFLVILLHSSLQAQDYRLKLGVGVASLYYPDYIGSRSTQLLTLPIPYIRYKGENFRIDKDGLSSKLLGVNGLKIDLSVSGSLPANSESNGVREGMPNLDLTAEIGLKLVYNLFEKGVSKLEFELPVRAVLSTDFTNIKYRGVVSNPQLRYSLNYNEFEWTFRTGLVFTNQEYNSYYYEVKKEYETSSRNAYDVSGGFSGFKNRVGMTYQKDSWWAGAFVSYYDVTNAVFKDSPLVETKQALYSGVSIAYVFYTQ